MFILTPQDATSVSILLLNEKRFKAADLIKLGLLQDVLRLDNSARMNFPGTVKNNWTWRIGEADVWQNLTQEAEDLHLMLETYDRLAPSAKTQKP